MAHKYQLVRDFTPGGLSRAVNAALVAGWELWGNTFTSYPGVDAVLNYCQAMIRLEPEPGRGAGDQAQAESAGYAVGVPETSDYFGRGT